MSSLPDNQVPKYENTEAMKYRNKQLLLQFPVQDSSFDRCNHIPQAAKHVFDQFTKAKEADMGTGHVEKAFRVKVPLLLLFGRNLANENYVFQYDD